MYFLKEKIGTTTCPRNHVDTYHLVLSKLGDLQFPIEKADQSKGFIQAKCLSRVSNFGIWRCWSEKLIIEIEKVDANLSSISICAIPNLLRFKSGRDEIVTDLDKVMLHLVENCR